jgi:hypothetical protein
MSIVSNASALINLARIGKLDLLRKLYGELIVPEAVWQEVVVEGPALSHALSVVEGAGQPGAQRSKGAEEQGSRGAREQRRVLLRTPASPLLCTASRIWMREKWKREKGKWTQIT